MERLKKSGEEWRELFKQVDELRAKGHLEIWREESDAPTNDLPERKRGAWDQGSSN